MKFNWPQLKQEYLLSPHMDVAEWGRQFFGSNKAVKSGNFHRHTAGWREEKEEYQEELTQMSIKKITRARLANYVRLTDKLFGLVEAKLTTTLSVRELHLIWQMLRDNQRTLAEPFEQDLDYWHVR